MLDVLARLINDRTLVPVRAVSKGLEADVTWIGNLKQVQITTKKVEAPEPTPSATAEPTQAPEPTTAPEPTADTETTYNYNELSPNDMETLKGCCKTEQHPALFYRGNRHS